MEIDHAYLGGREDLARDRTFGIRRKYLIKKVSPFNAEIVATQESLKSLFERVQGVSEKVTNIVGSDATKKRKRC